MPLTPDEERMRGVTACFTGHRQLENKQLPALSMRLDSVLQRLYALGYRRFLCGGARGFDQLAAERVLALREACPGIRLVMALPCATQSRSWPESDCRRYERILCQADETHVLSPVYYQGCMMVRNRYMVDRSSFCVCYLTHMKGGTVSTAVYASKENVPLINIAMEDACAAFVREGLSAF